MDEGELLTRIAILERKVADLYERLGQREPELAELAGDVSPEVLALLQQGKKIDAIKLYREQTGASLAAAKAFVESLIP